jgi:hypothetical protein
MDHPADRFPSQACDPAGSCPAPALNDEEYQRGLPKKRMGTAEPIGAEEPGLPYETLRNVLYLYIGSTVPLVAQHGGTEEIYHV